MTPPVSDCSLCATNPTPPTTHSYHTLITILHVHIHADIQRYSHKPHICAYTHAHTHTYQTTYMHMYIFTLTPHCQEEAEDKVGIAMSIENWGSVVT